MNSEIYTINILKFENKPIFFIPNKRIRLQLKYLMCLVGDMKGKQR